MNRTLLTIGASLLAASVLIAADPAPKSNAPASTAAPKAGAAAPTAAPASPTTPATTSTQPSAEQVLNELLRRRAENPIIEPSRAATAPTATVSPRSATIGTAPSTGPTPLRREGQFVITRRGRMVRAAGDSSAWMFAFEADQNGLQDPPMYLMPCMMLEDMEGLVQHHGDAAIFVVSGQVFVYRGANYLLPTLARLSPDRGNLKP